MRSKHRSGSFLAGIALVFICLGQQQKEATGNPTSNPKPSAFCSSFAGPQQKESTTSFASLIKMAGYQRIRLGFPWESIFQRRLAWTTYRSAPVIWGLPVESAGPSPRSLVLLPQTVNVTVQDNFFSPQVIHVAVGDTVRWTWAGTPHTVTAGECSTGIYEDCVVSNAFCSPNDLNCINNPTSGVGFVYSHQFNTAGTFRYFCREHLASMTGIVIVDAAASPTVQLSAATYNVNESSGVANLTITRNGTTTNGATVDYKTSDTAGLNNCSLVNGIASARCDYPTAVGTVRFAAGETVKNISIPIVDDGYAEGSENFTVTLSNPTGDSLGTPSSATVTINDNEASDGPNPIVGTQFFVRQQYLDFLGREPDPNGYASWQQMINNCPAGDTTCDRIHVSSAFFRSPEFQDRGYFVYRFYPVAFGRKPDYAEFVPDLAKVSGFLSDAELEAAKVAFINEFMSRPAFVTKFNGLTDTQYVDTLLSTAGVAQHQFRDFWIAALGNGTRTRATVLRDISETPEVYNKYFNQAFVVMQYFGYLRRDPDGLYVDWIAVLDANSSDFRGMVNGFMNSLEYRFRFGQ